MRKLVSLLLALSLCFGFVAATAQAADHSDQLYFRCRR